MGPCMQLHLPAGQAAWVDLLEPPRPLCQPPPPLPVPGCWLPSADRAHSHAALWRLRPSTLQWGENIADEWNAVHAAETPATDALKAVPKRWRTVKVGA